MEYLGADCIMCVLSCVRMTRDLRSMLCTCSLIRDLWREYSQQLSWRAEKSDNVFGVRSLYYSVKLTEDQRRTIEYVLGRAGDYPEKIMGSYVQLPMSSGKTIIGLSICLERVKKLGGTALCVFTEKVLYTAYGEVLKLFGREEESDCLVTVDGVRFVRCSDIVGGGNNSTESTVIVCSRKTWYLLSLIGSVHTIICDEVHTGPTSVKGILARCEEMSSRPLLVTLTAASVGTKRQGGIRVANIHGRSLEYFGYSSTNNINLPPVMYLIASTKKDVFYVEPSAASVETTRSKMSREFSAWLSRKKPGYSQVIAMLRASWEGNIEENSRLMAYVVDALELMVGRVFIITSPSANSGDIGNATLVHFATGASFVSNLEEIRETSKIVVGTTKAFSEGVNLVDFSNVILFNPSNDPEIIRQCVGRFQRMTNDTKMVSVCIITDTPSTSLVSMIPRSITDSYLEERGIMKIHVDESISELVTPDLSVGEMVAICYKTNKRAVTHNWLKRNGMINFRVAGGSLERVSGYRWRNVPHRSMEEAFMFYIDPETVSVSCVPMMNQMSPSYGETVSVPPPKTNDSADVMLRKLKHVADRTPSLSSEAYTVKELKELCALYNISASGTKAQIAKRILDSIC